MQLVESLANRVCLLQCNALSMIGDRECSLGALNFVFMLWDCTAYAVKMGCVQGDEGLLFIISYSSPDAGRRFFMGVPWVLKNGLSETASAEAVKFFLDRAMEVECLQAEIVFDGNLAVDTVIPLHLKFSNFNDDEYLLVKDIAKCENVLLVIDQFK